MIRYSLIGLAGAAALSASEVKFNRDILPVLSDKCFFCHGPDESNREADIRLDLREFAIETGAIAPGEPGKSFMIERIFSEDRDEIMPPPKSHLTLTDHEKNVLEQWIQEGAVYEKHWAFMTLDDEYAAPVSEPHPDLVRNGIDKVLFAGLETRGLRPQAEAGKTQLLRRVTFDLIGLPPTPDEVRAFLADDSADAYEQAVGRLLSRPEYGERMAVHWLDLARYADTYGLQVDQDRTVWAWRDWVIDAFNQNLPYDDFVTYQLAGDLLPNPTQEQRLATAFNRLHQQESEGGSIEEEFRVEYVNDRVNTFGTAFLGLTLECARCHDHKYDPISQKEYYQLFAFFDDIDEAGLYAYFGDAVPTPALELRDRDAEQEIARLEERAQGAEKRLAAARASVDAKRLDQWTREDADLRAKLDSGVRIDLKDDGEQDSERGRPFDGDEEFETEVGQATRHDAFSLAFSLWSSAHTDRKIICHRSKAWTDAANRGWELLSINGRLRFSLVHFWPGNAISIETTKAFAEQEWTDVVLTYDGSSRASGLRVYVNGALAEATVLKDNLTRSIGFSDIKDPPKGIVWGARFRDRGFTDGRVADPTYFESELDPVEVAALRDADRLESLKRKRLKDMTPAEVAFIRKAYADTNLESAVAANAALKEAREALGKLRDEVREIMTMVELPEPKKAYVLGRGSYDERKQEVFAETPSALSPFPADERRDRLGLARWLTRPDHPLFARVAVNRFWILCFGRGLVDTAEDFGLQGERPEYPELLDYLAADFMESGWDVKALMREIVTSHAYRQNSLGNPRMMADDPSNKMLARGPRYRLPAEMIRDGALDASGLLSKEIGGAPARPYDLSEAYVKIDVPMDESLYRRSLYTYWKRRAQSPLMMAFDAVKRDVCSAKRQTTNTPLQSLALLNGPQFVEAARVAGQRAWEQEDGNIEGAIRNLSLRFISREPDETELSILAGLFREQRTIYNEDAASATALLGVGQAEPPPASRNPADLAAVTIVAQTLMNFDESVVKR